MNTSANFVMPILYSFRRCPYAMRARWALVISQQVVEVREVVLRNKPSELLAASPKGTVPVLMDTDGTVIAESLDIMLWALRKKDPEHWLVPEVRSFDEMLTLIAKCDGEFKFNLDRYKYPERFSVENASIHRTAAANFLVALDSRLGNTPYFFGRHITLADIAIAPFVRQFALTDVAWFDQQAWAGLHRWLNLLLALPSFEVVMNRYAPWKPNNPPIPSIVNASIRIDGSV